MSASNPFAVRAGQVTATRPKGAPAGFDIRHLNALLIVCIVIVAVILAMNVMESAVLLHKDTASLTALGDLSGKTFAPLVSSLKDENYYLEQAKKRDIFALGTHTQSAENVTVTRGPSAMIVEATKDFHLVGISWSDDPDAMIEDVKNQATFFLKKGQMVDNNVVVKDIQKDKVILSFKGEDVEIQ